MRSGFYLNSEFTVDFPVFGFEKLPLIKQNCYKMRWYFLKSVRKLF